MEEKNSLEQASISYDVFNALNLINEKLGKAYEEKGYNPYGEQFSLDANYAQTLLEKAKGKKSLDTEQFLENGNRAVSQNFKLALENTEALKLDILAEMESAEPAMKDKLSEVVLYLNNRAELLSQAIEALKSGEASSLKLYEEVYNIDSVYGEILKESFLKNFNKTVAVENFLSTCRLRIKFEEFKQEQVKEQEKLARQKITAIEKKIDRELKAEAEKVQAREEKLKEELKEKEDKKKFSQKSRESGVEK